MKPYEKVNSVVVMSFIPCNLTTVARSPGTRNYREHGLLQ